MKRLYIVSQIFIKHEGSFSGVFEEFSRYASSKGYEVIILCGQENNEPQFEELPYAVVYRFPTIRFPIFKSVINAISLAIHVRKYFRKNLCSDEDILLANGEASLGLIGKRYILRAVDQPPLLTIKNMELAKNEVPITTRVARAIHFLLLHIIDYLVVKNAIGITFSSFSNRRENIKYYRIEKKSYFIPNKAVSIKKFGDCRKVRLSGKTLLFISKDNEKIRKGKIYLEKVLPEIFRKYDDLKVIHIGGKFEWNVPEQYKERIISVGKVPWEKMKDYYASADVFVSCSLNEGFPNTILEAMAAGCPVISSDIEGIREYITHLKEGYIYKRGDCEALKEGIIYMLENQKEREEMAKRAKEKIKKLDYEIYSEKLLEFLEKVNEGKVMYVNLLEE